MIIVAIAALIGGRLYHVIDQWQLYKDDLAKIVLPPDSGLGVYGGIVTGTSAFGQATPTITTPEQSRDEHERMLSCAHRRTKAVMP